METKLVVCASDLLGDYQRYERPVCYVSDAVDVKLGINLQQIVDWDINVGILTSNVWLSVEWKDVNLQWNMSYYDNIKDIRLPSKEIWIPDIIPYNAADYDAVNPHKCITDIVVTSNGECTWIPPMNLKTVCKIDDTADEQSCKMKFGSWTYNGFKINLELQSDSADTSMYVVHKIWELVSAKGERNEMFYACCPEPYFDITYTLKLKKRSSGGILGLFKRMQP